MTSLPQADPWRQLAGSDDCHVREFGRIEVPHGEWGAWSETGVRFGTYRDALDLVRADDADGPSRDPHLAAYAEPLGPTAAFLLVSACEGVDETALAIDNVLTHRTVDLETQDLHVHHLLDSALRWALARRAAYVAGGVFVVHASAAAMVYADSAVLGIKPESPDFAIHAGWAGRIDDDAYEAVRAASLTVSAGSVSRVGVPTVEGRGRGRRRGREGASRPRWTSRDNCPLLRREREKGRRRGCRRRPRGDTNTMPRRS